MHTLKVGKFYLFAKEAHTKGWEILNFTDLQGKPLGLTQLTHQSGYHKQISDFTFCHKFSMFSLETV
ncbi:MAG: hypothetical protein ACKPKO_40730, partial [Candidatus Fonsibacter sp.]